jgi:hypothetical protein
VLGKVRLGDEAKETRSMLKYLNSDFQVAEILNQYTTEVPKVISDLKSSGISFNSASRQNHFVKNEEFKKHVAK